MVEKFEHVKFTSDDIGVMLLESITKGLYTDARHCIREYIQNEYDADASVVYVDVGERTVSVMGDSGGMTKDGLLRARRIGYSEKDPTSNAGFRGIGIWSGVAVCNRMNVITKAKGAEIGYYLRVDANGLREAIKRREQKPLVDALTEHVLIREIRADEFQEKYGTRVELVDVLREHDRILDQKELMDYLSQTCPVAINPFQPLAKEVLDRVKQAVPGYREIVVRVNQKPVNRPPERDTALQLPFFQAITTDDGDALGFCWYAMNQTPGTLSAEERGLVYKAKGFTIGDPERTTVKKLEPGASVQQNVGWVTGEIHLINRFLIPNSERIDLETNSTSELFRNKVREILRRIDKEVRSFSEKRSADAHVADAEAQLVGVDSAPDPQAKLEKLVSLQRAGELLDQDLKSAKISTEMRVRMGRAIQQIEQRKKDVFKEIRIPVDEAPVSKEKRREALAKRTREAEAVDLAAQDMIKGFKLSETESRLFLTSIEALRAAGVPDSRLSRFLVILEQKIAYRRLHKG